MHDSEGHSGKVLCADVLHATQTPFTQNQHTYCYLVASLLARTVGRASDSDRVQ